MPPPAFGLNPLIEKDSGFPNAPDLVGSPPIPWGVCASPYRVNRCMILPVSLPSDFPSGVSWM
jgi:hypothetical protein